MIEGMKINQNQKKQYLEKGYWTQDSLLDCWLRTLDVYRDREYVADDRGNHMTYGQIDEAAGKVASYLNEIGVTMGETVSFQVPVWSEFVIICIACLKAGAILHPVAMCYEEEDLIHALKQTDAKVYFGPTWYHKTDYETRVLSIKEDVPSLKHLVFLDNLKEAQSGFPTLRDILLGYEPLKENARMDGFDVAVILGTSGTTGGSKGVMLTHNNIIYSEKQFSAELGLTDRDVIFMPAPLNHATGFHHGIIAPMLIGGKVVLQQKFRTAEAIALMNREQCTYSMGSTPFIYDILKEMERSGEMLEHLKFYLCGGAPVPGEMVQKADRYGITLCEVYGSTESVPHVYVHPQEALERNGTTSGSPIQGVEIKLVDEAGMEVLPGTPGEELSRGPNVFVGYVKNQTSTDQVLDEDGWFHSGDLCVQADDGSIRVVGRKKDMIVRGGENLNSNAINAYIDGCPGVRDHAVVGMPDERLGERICAYVVLEPEISQMALEQLTRHFEAKKAAKRFWPERLELIDQIPRTPSGKVKKYLLLEELERRMSHD